VIRINLLPQEERTRQRRLPTIKIPQVGAVVPFVVLGLVVGVIATTATVQSRNLVKLKQDIEVAQAESAKYKPQLEKIRQITQQRAEVRSRLDMIANLDRQRYYRVQLLDDLSRSIPSNLWISSFSEVGKGTFQIDGVTFSNFNVAKFMNSLDETGQFTSVDLTVAEKGTIDELDVVQFSLISGARP
jgi:type IV pilus assembly protein PilN